MFTPSSTTILSYCLLALLLLWLWTVILDSDACMQDANWRELLRFCFVRGAYRGAGADLLGNLLRTGNADDGSLFGVTEDQDGAQYAFGVIRLLQRGRMRCRFWLVAASCIFIKSTQKLSFACILDPSRHPFTCTLTLLAGFRKSVDAEYLRDLICF